MLVEWSSWTLNEAVFGWQGFCHRMLSEHFSPTHLPLIRVSSSDEGFRDTALLVTYSSIGYPDDRDRVVGNEQQTDQLCIALVRLISVTSTVVLGCSLSVCGIPIPPTDQLRPE